MQVLKRIKLDFARSLNPITVFAKQGDANSRVIEIEPLENGETFTIPQGVIPRLQLTKPDGHTVINDAEVNGKVISVLLTEQALAAAGLAIAEIALYKGNELLSSQTFYIDIKQSAYNPDAVESSDEYQSLLHVLDGIDEAVEMANSAVEKAAQAASDAEKAVDKATSAVDNIFDMITSLDETPLLTSSEITVDGDTVKQTQATVNIKTGETGTKTDVIPLANSENAGMMSPSDVLAIQEHTAKIAALEGQTVRLLYTASTSPTAEQVGEFVTAAGYTENLQNVAVVISGTFHIWHWYDNTATWRDDGVDAVSLFTNAVAGAIKGTEIEGKIYAENDGTGSVYGWDGAMTRLSAAEKAISAQPNFLTLTQEQYESLGSPDENTYYFIVEASE